MSPVFTGVQMSTTEYYGSVDEAAAAVAEAMRACGDLSGRAYVTVVDSSRRRNSHTALTS